MSHGLEVLPRGGDWSGARVGILGLGRSGRGALRLLERAGAVVLAFDDRVGPDARAALEAEGMGHVDLIHAAAGAAGRLEGLDVLVVSPGVPGTHPLISAAEIAGIVVVSELELAWRATGCDVIAVTGTNGKSTTVSLVHALLGAAGLDAVLAGNIGVALSDEVEGLNEESVLVVECSSFQLERLMDFRPRVAAILNIAPDHLDRYSSFEDYAIAKRNLLRNQMPEDHFVFPAGDGRLEAWARDSVARGFRFASGPGEGVQAWVDDGQVWRRMDGQVESICELSGLRLLGRHNQLNVVAALAIVAPWKIDRDTAREVLLGFEALPHRATRVPTEDGRLWIDDSKATNVHAASATLSGMEGPVVLLAGGSGKDEDYSPLAAFADRVRCVLCFGAEAKRIEEAIDDRMDCELFGTLVEALERAKGIAEVGDTILLSPACASFDEFRGFAERGEVFADWVANHAGVDR